MSNFTFRVRDASRPGREASRTRKGSILITTLWIMAILALLAVGIGFRSSLEVRISKYSMDRLKARYLAKAGIVKARQYLSEDKDKIDTLYKCGITLELGEDEETVRKMFDSEFNQLGKGSFSVHYIHTISVEETSEEGEVSVSQQKIEKLGMVDEERKININVSKLTSGDKNEYVKIMNNFLPAPEEDIDKLALINAMLDWQDAVSVGEAENNYYEGLERPYKCKNKDFELIEELLLVKGMTGKYFEKIQDYITVYGEGKINANTAPGEVLKGLLIHPAPIDEVIAFRESTDGIEGTKDDRFWNDTARFSGFLAKYKIDPEMIERHFVVKSDYFRVISHGSMAKVESKITCVIKRETDSKKEEKEAYEYYHEE